MRATGFDKRNDGFRDLDRGEALPGAVETLRSKPAAALWGGEDRTLPRTVIEAMFRPHGQDAPLVTVPGAGHYAQEDAPETLLALIEQFVQATGPAGGPC
ncbi:MAG: alpha/beta fold hydrolase [Myxococcota bacterium]